MLPEGVKLRSVKSRVEELDGPLPECDALICNLVLHHVPGRDVAECEEQGLTERTAAKLEVLRAFRAALDARNGRLFFTDSDKFTEIALAPGDPVLAEQMVDACKRCPVSHSLAHQKSEGWLAAQTSAASAPPSSRTCARTRSGACSAGGGWRWCGAGRWGSCR